MLVHLAIKNLAVIAETALDFGPGLNALTGQTGAGKSIVVGALNLVLGDRARSDTVRTGADKAEVQALFQLPADSRAAVRLAELDLTAEGDGGRDELLVRRVIGANGRGRVYVNGVLSTVGTLADVTRGLVDISSQHQHTALLDPDGHLPLLDRFGELATQLAAYHETWSALVAARAARDALAAREAARVQREDFVRFQLEEIRELAPEAGEQEALTQERDRLRHAEQLSGGARAAESSLTGASDAVAERLRDSVRSLERLGEIDPELGELAERLESARIEVEDIGYDLARYASAVDSDPRRLEVVEDRLDALRKLTRKHGGDVEHVLAQAELLAEELAGFESLEIDLKEADERREAALERARAAAATLSAARAEAALRLGDRVSAELQTLAMGGAAVQLELTPTDALGPAGMDAGELTIRTNTGEPFKALARVASGGELSRLLLALKSALTRIDPVLTAVFDEVDTGVGGAVAEVIGLKLAEIARERQVITITHLPQIAAQASHHLLVEKHTDDARAEASVRVLDAQQRADEIARMLGGVKITERTRAHAEELLSR